MDGVFTLFFYLLSCQTFKYVGEKKSKIISHWQGNTHMCNFKDTGQRVDRTLNGFQHGPLGGHVLLGRHGNAKHARRENKKSQPIKNVGEISVQKCNLWKIHHKIQNLLKVNTLYTSPTPPASWGSQKEGVKLHLCTYCTLRPETQHLSGQGKCSWTAGSKKFHALSLPSEASDTHYNQ